jgi:CheY-like chemotaxis protein
MPSAQPVIRLAPRLMLLDDNPTLRECLAMVLQSGGYDVLQADSGAQALQCVEENGLPDLVIQDLLLPHEPGFSIIDFLRRHPGGEQVPVLALSGSELMLEHARRSGAGFCEYLHKPIEPVALLDAVRQYVRVVSEQRNAPGRGLTALVVDDSSVQARLTCLRLEELGFVVHHAWDGVEGLQRLRSRRPDVVVSDIMMPCMDGFQLCHAIRLDPELRDLPVVLTSASYLDEADRRLAKDVGANEFALRTPDLAGILRAVLRSVEPGHPVPPASLTLPEEYLSRQVAQLRRQAELNQELAARCAQQETALALLGRLSSALCQTGDIRTSALAMLEQMVADGLYLAAAIHLLDQPDWGWLQRPEQHSLSFPPGELAASLQDGCPRLLEVDKQRLVLCPILLENSAIGFLLLAEPARRRAQDVFSFPRVLCAQLAQCLALARTASQRAIEQEQLRQAQKMEAVGQLAGGVAHDFNNLLTVISGVSELAMLSLPPDSPLIEELQEIHKASEKATHLTKQLLTFSRHKTPSVEVVDLNEVLRDVATMLRRLIGEDVLVQLELTNAPTRLRMESGRLEQVLVNLAVNARDAMRGGGGLLTFSTEARQDVLVLTVRDNGCGMDEYTRQRLFEPFFSTKGEAGTGLGLAMVYGIVHGAGGKIHVDSAPGQGTVFTMEFPAAAQVLTAEASATGAAAAGPGGHTVLLVEDDDGVRAVAYSALSARGYAVLQASNADEAMTLNESHPGSIDLLLTDVVLPGCNGFTLARQLSQRRRGLRTLFMSGYTDYETLGEEAEPTHFLQKPFSLDSLSRSVQACLAGHGSHK